MLRIYTLGYEGLSLEDYILILKEHDIDLLIDVRENPSSKKVGFSEHQIRHRFQKELLRVPPIEYVGMKELGTPKKLRDKYQNDFDGLAKSFKRLYEERKPYLEMLLARTRGKTPCLMCYEANPKKCHRSIVADELAEIHGDAEVIHLKKGG